MAVVNVTPDSFSDGGRFLEADRAVDRALRQVELGADLVDVGGESTRPGAERVPASEELDRVLPVVRSLIAEGVFVSIDTMRSEVAQAAVAAGAVIVNDVSGGLADDQMLPVVAGLGVPIVLMHWRGHSRQMHERAQYPAGAVNEVMAELSQRLEAAVAAGLPADRVVLDPGLGFAKESGQPFLVGASRKRFLGELLAVAGKPRPVDERDDATVAVSALAAAAGAWCVRVHDARGNVDAVRVAEAWDMGHL
jgi:dihydropteroate synthase